MSKSLWIAPLAAIVVCWPAPARAAIYPELQTWLDGWTDKAHKWVDCPMLEADATAANPLFKFNPSTSDPKFDCKQVGPRTMTSATWPGTEAWWVQHARFLRVKPCETYPTCSIEKGECVKSMYCKVEAVRACSPAYIGKPGNVDPFGKDGPGKNGCVIIWVEETEAQRPDLPPNK
jgi:hypothetical protein